MVLKSSDFADYIERVERDLQILKTYHEIGGAEASESSGKSAELPENLSRDELIRRIYEARDEALDCINSCDSHDIMDITQNLADELLKIDVLSSRAIKEIKEIRRRADNLEHELPVNFSLYHPGTISTLMFIPIKLNELEVLCSIYQNKFANE